MRSIGWLNKAVVAVVLLMSAATLSAGDHGKKYKRGHFPRGKAHGYYGKHYRHAAYAPVYYALQPDSCRRGYGYYAEPAVVYEPVPVPVYREPVYAPVAPRRGVAINVYIGR
jgi:hypothetical protein